MEQDFTPELGDSIVEAVSDEQRHKLQNDPMYQLQHDKEDKEKARTVKDRLIGLLDLSEATTRADYDVNCKLRRKNRSARKRALELLEEGNQRGLSIPLLEPSEDDAVQAKEVMRNNLKRRSSSNSSFAVSERVRRVGIVSAGIFDTPKDSGGRGEEKSRTGKLADEKAARRSSRPSSASCPPSVSVSSAARAHHAHQSAMRKAAERNIRVRHMKVSDRPALRQDTKPTVHVSATGRRLAKGVGEGARESRDRTSVATPKEKCNCVHVSRALDMISAYSDGESDS